MRRLVAGGALAAVLGGLVLGAAPAAADHPRPGGAPGATLERQPAPAERETDGVRRWLPTADAVLVRPRETQWDRHLAAALRLPSWLDLGLEHRTRFEVYDHPWRTSQQAGRTDPQIQQRSRLRLGLGTGPVRVLFEGQDARVHLDDPGDFVNDSIVDEADILQLLVSATATDLLGTGLRTDLHLGRLTMDVGSRRFVARNGFRNTTNAFDGLHWQLAREGTWRLRAFLVEPVLRAEEQPDEQSGRQVFWGAYLETEHPRWLKMNAYYFGLNDLQGAPPVQRTHATLGLRLYEEAAVGRPDYEVESAVQTGTVGGTDHVAYLVHLDLGYTLDLPWAPRVLVHYDYASGTRTPGGSQSGSFDTLFGGRRWEYMPTGNFGPFFRRNLSSPGWRVVATPAPGWRVQLKHRVWYLAQARDEFAGTGLQDATGGAGNFLGHDLEVRLQWQVDDNLAFDVGYDHWFKGTYFDRLPASAGLPPGGGRDSDYVYVSTQVRF